MSILDDYINKKRDPYVIYLPDLVQELVDYDNKPCMEQKVMRVYGKCLRQKHFELAARICKKYNRYFMSANQSDIAMAFGYALMASKKYF